MNAKSAGVSSIERARTTALSIIDRLRPRTQFEYAEASWVLATNDRMNGAVAALGSQHYKTWRMYRRGLG